jgi:hypothetical protein
MTFAGLWDSWTAPDGDTIKSFAIIATTANELLQPLHARMPVLLTPQDWAPWLGETGTAAIQSLAQALSQRRHGFLAGRPARRQRQSGPIRPAPRDELSSSGVITYGVIACEVVTCRYPVNWNNRSGY